jgi:Flp pilus assembly pilin Flp
MLTFLKNFWRAQTGQDMIEYALIAATLAIVVAGFLPPSIMPSISTIFSTITSTMALS